LIRINHLLHCDRLKTRPLTLAITDTGIQTKMGNKADIISMVIGADPVVQMVLVLLLLMSVLCWTIILLKARLFRKASAANDEFDCFFSEAASLAQVESRARRMKNSPMAQVFLCAYADYQNLQADVKIDNVRLVRQAWMDVLTRSLEKAVKLEIQDMETAIPLLATTGNSAPFIGLFGTVWGIMSSFQNIGLQGSASLATVAPGISEALVATAAGLAAAIPAVIAFNMFMSSIASMEKDLNAFGVDFINIVERELVKRETVHRGSSGMMHGMR